MRRSIWHGLVVAVAAVTVLAVQPALRALGAGGATAAGVSVTFTAVSDWGTGHEARVTVSNGTTGTIATWRIEFDLPDGTAITSFWDADVVRTGNHYVATQKSWEGPLAPGASQTWGYIGSGPFRQPTLTGGPGPTTAPPTTAPSTTQPPPPPPGAHQV